MSNAVSSPTRKAIVCGYEIGSAGCFVHVAFEDEPQRGLVRVPIDVHPDRLPDIQVGVSVAVPLDDITKPEIAASIEWKW